MTWAWLLIALLALGSLAILCIRLASRWMYRPTSQFVIDLLSRSLAGTATHKELDYFISMPIRHDRKLEMVRNEFAAIYGPDSFEANVGSP